MLNKYFISSVILLLGFIVLAIIVSPKTNLDENSLINADYLLFLKINNSHYQELNQFMIYLSQYGRETFWILAVLLLFIFGKKTGKKTALVISVSMIVLIPVGIVAKELIERPRPVIPETNFLIAVDSEYTFPSGHALMVSAGAAIALILFRGSYKELTVSILLTIEAALVCFSRVYVGVHYPLDVLGGILLGVGVSLLFIWKGTYIEFLFFQIKSKFKRSEIQ